MLDPQQLSYQGPLVFLFGRHDTGYRILAWVYFSFSSLTLLFHCLWFELFAKRKLLLLSSLYLWGKCIFFDCFYIFSLLWILGTLIIHMTQYYFCYSSSPWSLQIFIWQLWKFFIHYFVYHLICTLPSETPVTNSVILISSQCLIMFCSFDMTVFSLYFMLDNFLCHAFQYLW